MKGCTFKRKLRSGRIVWGFSVDAGPDEKGKRIRLYKTGFRRQADAQTELTKALHELHDGQVVKPSPRTFAHFMEEWFREHAAVRCTPKTAERYRQLASYVLPQLGTVQLRSLSTLMLDRAFNRIHKSGGREGAKLSARTVRHVAGLVHVALNTAVRWKLIKSNPADACALPKVETKEAKALDPTQTEWLLEAARGNWLYPIFVLALATGCRRGELLALAWPDVDLKRKSLSVSKSLEQSKDGLRTKRPKNEKARTFPLPAVAAEVLAAHREDQQKSRKLFGSDYRVDLDLVFASPNGEYLKPDSVTAAACLFATKAGLAGVGLHSLRHSHASQLLSAGVSLPTVSKRLGHSSVQVTATIYSHSFSHDEVSAAEVWDATMRHTVPKTNLKQ